MLNNTLTSISTDELLQRIYLQPVGNVWSAIVTDPDEFEDLVEELEDTIPIFAECGVEIIFADLGVSELIEQVKNASEDYILLCEFKEWSAEDWREFNYLRNQLDQHRRGGMLLLSIESVNNLFRYAPHLASWLGASVYHLNLGTEYLTEAERENRLVTLREWSNQTDSEVIKLAEAKELPLNPEYGEWLILLGRGDLIKP